MSRRDKGFVPDFLVTPRPLLLDKRLTESDRNVYAAAYWYERMKDGVCKASNDALGMVACCGDRKVRQALDRLEKYGYIIRMYKDKTRRVRLEIRTLVAFSNVGINMPTSEVGTGKPTHVGTDMPQNKNISNITTYSGNTTAPEVPTAADAAAEAKAVYEKLVADIIDQFKPINPSYKLLFSRKPQREAVKRMLTEMGEAKLRATIIFLPRILKKVGCPQVTTPCQLEDNLGRLIIFTHQLVDKRTGGRPEGLGIVQTT